MFTVITGTPGAGKTLYAVSQEAQAVPGSTLEAGQTCTSHGVEYRKGDAVPRHLFSNIRGLLVEHQMIDASDLERWHTWSQPGDVILFDEVQEVWRPRGLGVKVPDAIAAVETHRHMGVDLVLVTQHPMLIDPNLRRLVNRHLHIRRMASFVSMIYEWDHCSNPGQVKTALSSRMWWFPRKAFGLYKSAQLHTKTKARIPPVLWLGVAAVAGLAIGGPMVYSRLSGRFTASAASVPAASPLLPASSAGRPGRVVGQVSPVVPGAPGPTVPASAPGGGRAAVAGCGVVRGACRCFDTQGGAVDAVPATCEALGAGGPALDLGGLGGRPGGGVSDGSGDALVLAAMRDGRWAGR